MAQRPNILMIVTDQQRRDTIGAYGSAICRTPNIDRIATEGIRFDNAFTPTGLCSPVRCSLLTGLYPHGHKVLTNVGLHPVREQLDPGDDVLANAMAANSYRLGYVGKWHVSAEDPPAFGYENYVSLGDFLERRQEVGALVPDEMYDYSTQVAALDPAPADHSRPRFLADNAVRLIEKYRADPDRPFFVRLDFHGPHFPNVVPEPYFSMYPPSSIPPWPNHDDSLDGKPGVQKIKQRHWGTDTYRWANWQPLVSAYFGEISLIDEAIGSVLSYLDGTDLQEETLVIMTTDHGDTIGAHGICNKDYTMYEEIYLVPLLMRWPGVIAPGRASAVYTHHFLDIFASLLDITDQALPDECHGRSLVPVLKGEPPDNNWPQEAYCQFHGSHMGLYSMRMLTTDDYAYVYHTNDIDEFYDRHTDPYQLHNLAEEPGEHVAALRDVKRRMVAWMAKTHDHLHNDWTVRWLTDDPELADAAPGRRRTKW